MCVFLKFYSQLHNFLACLVAAAAANKLYINLPSLYIFLVRYKIHEVTKKGEGIEEIRNTNWERFLREKRAAREKYWGRRADETEGGIGVLAPDFGCLGNNG